MFSLLAFATFLFFLPGSATAAEKFALQSDVDHVWTMAAAALVFLMQAGFMLLEAGTVRAKNSVNVAQKNLIDFLLSTVCYGAIGFAMMFGVTQGGWVGCSGDIAFFKVSEDWSMTFFVFQLVFCGTAATIVSGAVAERMSMPGYMMCTVLIAVVIYPVVGHWVWGGDLNGQTGPWLADMGFMDFAGGTVVHSLGAWVGLAAIILIGARQGKFDANGDPVTLHGHSPILATAGLVIMWVGWIGFNGGSTAAGTGDFARIVQNTMISAGLGGVTALFLSWWLTGFLTPAGSINGVLAGLVAITSGCNVLDGQGAMTIGILAGGLVILSERVFERHFKLDDPMGAVSVHGVCGAAGTVMLAVLAPEEALLVADRGSQIVVQLVGVGSVFVWSFGVAFAVLWCLSRVFSPGGGRSGLRVSEEHEIIGLNVAEHNAPLGVGVLQSALQDIANAADKDFEPIVLERGDEAFEMAELINKIMGDLHAALAEMDVAVAAAAEGDFSHRINLSRFAGTPRRLCSGMNKINESCDAGLRMIQTRLTQMANGDLASRIDAEMKGQFADLCETLSASTETLSDTLARISDSAALADAGGQRIEAASRQLYQLGESQQASLSAAMPVLDDVRMHSNADSHRAREAAANCAQALVLTEEGAEVAQATLAQMDAVAEAVANIDLAVDQIEDIARAINLLAINAGVEAARLGTADGNGSASGFRILAQEVRSLAHHTRDTVEQVREKSALVATATRQTHAMVGGLRSSFDTVRAKMRETTALSEAVANAGAEQERRLRAVSDAVREVQQNSERTAGIIQTTKNDAGSLARDARETSSRLAGFTLAQSDQRKAA